MSDTSLADAVRAKYRLSPLKPLRVRITRSLRRLKFNSHSASPLPYLLETEDGRRFKWLRADRANRHKIDVILFCYEIVSHLDFVPRLVWHDDRSVLFEYVEGEAPDVTSADFAEALGRNLAKVNGLDVGALPASTVRRMADMYLLDLVALGLCEPAIAERIRGRLAGWLPSRLRTSLSYADLQAGNFCLTKEGRLVFLDLGAFQQGRLTDEGLLGHPLARTLNFDVFERSYRKAGGTEDLFLHRRPVAALGELRRAARLARWAQALPFAQAGRRRALRRRAEEYAERLRTLV